jgi:siroheme decarboxylase
MLTDLEKDIVSAIGGDIPITSRPFLEMAQTLGISESVFLEALENLCQRGVVRRFGATIRHQQSGFAANAMVAWQVDEDCIDAVGRIMAAFEEVSHCYRRNPRENWPYNLYTMIHAKDCASCLEIAREMAQKAGVETYTPLFSLRELKKTSMEYFPTDNES